MSGSKAIIVGAGMSGLACAVELCRHGFDITVLEAAPTVGGRTRSFDYRGVELDNGQHIMLSVYQRLFELLEIVDADRQSLYRQAFNWSVFHRTDGNDKNSGSDLRNFSLSNRDGICSAIRQLGALDRDSSSWARGLSLSLGTWPILFSDAPGNIDASQWLIRCRQNDQLNKLLWEPLCLAALNTPASLASAISLQAVLRRVLPKLKSLNFIFNRWGLSRTLAEPCVKFLNNRGARVKTGLRVKEIVCDADNKITGVLSTDGRLWNADIVVSSLSAPACRRLLRESRSLSPTLDPLIDVADSFDCSPIETLYLQFDQAVAGSEAIFGFIGEPIDWVIDRQKINGQNGLLAVVASARTIDISVDSVLDLLGRVYGQLPRLCWHKSIIEKCASFSCTAKQQSVRPSMRTDTKGLWLNGDWLANSLPATIETAVDNGFCCARQIAGDN